MRRRRGRVDLDVAGVGGGRRRWVVVEIVLAEVAGNDVTLTQVEVVSRQTFVVVPHPEAVGLVLMIRALSLTVVRDGRSGCRLRMRLDH